MNSAKASRTMTVQAEKSTICNKPPLTAVHAGIVTTPPLGWFHIAANAGQVKCVNFTFIEARKFKTIRKERIKTIFPRYLQVDHCVLLPEIA